MWAIIEYIILTASRDKLFIGILLLVLSAIGLGSFIGNSSVVEQVQSVTAIVGGTAAYLIILGLTVFACFHIKRSFENKEIELFLTKPITRSKFILSYFIGMSVVAALIVVPLLITMLALQNIGFLYGHKIDYTYWCLSLYMECLIVIMFAIFAALLLKSAVISVLATLGFYIFAKITGLFFILLNNPIASGFNNPISLGSKKLLHFICLLFPRLDLFSQTEWLIYGFTGIELLIRLLASTLVFLTLTILCAIYDFKKYEF